MRSCRICGEVSEYKNRAGRIHVVIERDDLSGFDDFWDVDMMTPPKRKGGFARRVSDTETVEIEIASGNSCDDLSEPIPEKTGESCGKRAFSGAADSDRQKANERAWSDDADNPDGGENRDKEPQHEHIAFGHTASGHMPSDHIGKEHISNEREGAPRQGSGTSSEPISAPEHISDDNESAGRISPDFDRLEKAKSTLAKTEEKFRIIHPGASFQPVRMGVQARSREDDRELADFLSDSIEPSKKDIICEYFPENPLIGSVQVFKWNYKYTFYEKFLSDARKAHGMIGEETDFQPFFSYLPQYANLSSAQLKYYLWWRDNLRRSVYLETSYSYIQLYIFEIINLPDLIKPEDGVRQLCLMWRNYRRNYPRLDRDLCEWMCDYCLSNNVTPDIRIIGEFMPEFVNYCSLREFYLGLDNQPGSPYAKALYNCCPTYSFKKSKFVTKENAHIFEKHIKNAFIYAITKLGNEGGLPLVPLGEDAMFKRVSVRNTFDSAVCAYNIKRRLRIEYLSCKRLIEHRALSTDTVKYAENQIRSLLGIRSRFHLPDLPDAVKKAVDEYFRPYTERAKEKKKAEAARKPESESYEKNYDAEDFAFSAEYSRELERQSWIATDMLVEKDVNGSDEKSGSGLCGQNMLCEKAGKEFSGKSGQPIRGTDRTENLAGAENGAVYREKSEAESRDGVEAGIAQVRAIVSDSGIDPDSAIGSDSTSDRRDKTEEENVTVSANEVKPKNGAGQKNGIGTDSTADSGDDVGAGRKAKNNGLFAAIPEDIGDSPARGAKADHGADCDGAEGGGADTDTDTDTDMDTDFALTPNFNPNQNLNPVTAALDALIKQNRRRFAEIAEENHLLPDALVDMINEAAYDIVGDIAIENSGAGYMVIPDYIKELEEWIISQQSR